jgi:cytochrome c556
MKKIACLLICSAVFTAALAVEKVETELERTMGDMNRAFRSLKKQVRDPVDFAGALASVATLRKSTEAAMTREPAMTADKSPQAQPEFVAAYKQGVKAMLKVVDDLEMALKANDAAKAVELVGQLSSQQKEGHRKFKKPD